MLRVDDAHGAGFRAHDHGLGAGATREAPHPLEHGAVGDAGGREHDLAAGEVVQAILAVEIGDAPALAAGAFGLVAEHQPALELAADAAQRRRRQHPFRRAADAHVDVDAAVRAAGRDHARNVAVADQHDARAGLARFDDDLVVARPVEDAGDQVGNIDLLGLGQVLEVDRRSLVQVDQIRRQAAADRDLVHVGVGRVQKAAGPGHGDHRERVRPALGGQRGALERIERDVDLGAAGADFLADIEHRRLVALALADHHPAVDGQAVERPAHGVDRGLIGRLLVAAPHQPPSRQSRRLGNPNRLQRQIAVHLTFVCHAVLVFIGREARSPPRNWNLQTPGRVTKD